jgi:hypothetical protein
MNNSPLRSGNRKVPIYTCSLAGLWMASFFFFFFVVLRIEHRAYTLSQSISPFFVISVFEIGLHELFAWAGFQLWSFWSLPPESLGLQEWALASSWWHRFSLLAGSPGIIMCVLIILRRASVHEELQKTGLWAPDSKFCGSSFASFQ